MPGDSVQEISYAATIIGVVSAVAAVISAYLACMSYRKSAAQFEKSQKENFIKQTSEKLDKVYIDLSEFVQVFTEIDETKWKRVVREKIVFSLEALRVDFFANKSIDNEVNASFGDISLKISDITYEENFEKIMRDLAIVRNGISDLKKKIFVL